MKDGISKSKIATGVGALLLWLLIFSSGLLVETIEQRRYFAPEFYHDQTRPENATPFVPTSAIGAFLVATFCYIPTNLVCLSLLAGLIGGCASDAYVANLDDEQLKTIDARRLAYLQASPWSAMTRGFVVYLCVIAGLYFVVDEPFKVTTPPQYVRLAGTVSFLSFVVGFDPTQIDHWLRLGRNALPARGNGLGPLSDGDGQGGASPDLEQKRSAK